MWVYLKLQRPILHSLAFYLLEVMLDKVVDDQFVESLEEALSCFSGKILRSCLHKVLDKVIDKLPFLFVCLICDQGAQDNDGKKGYYYHLYTSQMEDIA